MPQATATVNGVEVARSDTWEVVDGNIYVRWPQSQLKAPPDPQTCHGPSQSRVAFD
jgi:hypothetical protein